MAGLIKATLVIKHGQVPPNLHFHTPNPAIDFESLKIKVPTTVTDLPGERTSCHVGVNSFGFGGTNAHVVLSAPPARPRASTSDKDLDAPFLLPLSARSPEGLKDTAQAYLDFDARERWDSDATLADICFSAGARRTHFDHRVSFVIRDRADLKEQLLAFVGGDRRGLQMGRSGREPVSAVFCLCRQGRNGEPGPELLAASHFPEVVKIARSRTVLCILVPDEKS
jgi:acyl transferase domain-containing protein